MRIDRRAVTTTDHVERAGHGKVVDIVPRRIAPRAGLAETGHRTVDQAGIAVLEIVIAQPELGQIIAPVLAGWIYEASDSFSYPLLLASILLVVTLLPLVRDTADACET